MKKKISDLIPYKIKDGKVFVFLQKRTKDAPNYPDMFGFFGGAAEDGETPDEALKREIKEELNIVPANYWFLGRYDLQSIKDLYAMEVDDSFESRITVLEGEYGKFFSEEELQRENIIEEDKATFSDFFQKIKP